MRELDLGEIMNQRQNSRNHLDGCNFRFYRHHKLNKERTDEAGYPQHDPVDFIEITNFAGERTPRPVEDRDVRAYPEAYARYQATLQKPVSGMWLVEWCAIQSYELADLQGFGLTTVEEVADLSKDILERNQWLISYQRKADNWLTSAKSKQAEVAKLKEELFQQKRQYQTLVDQYSQAVRRIEATEGTRFNA